MSPFKPLSHNQAESEAAEAEHRVLVVVEVVLAAGDCCIKVQHEEEVGCTDRVACRNKDIEPHVNRFKGRCACPEVQSGIKVEEANYSDTDLQTVAQAI